MRIMPSPPLERHANRALQTSQPFRATPASTKPSSTSSTLWVGAALAIAGARSLDEGGDRLIGLDDVGGEHAAGVGAEVDGVVRCAGRDEERVAGVQREGGPVAEVHLDGAG